MATCSDVTTCLSEGSTECTLGSETCPPCVYALTGGDYSCYSRDTSGKCPFSGTYAECDKTSSSTSKSTSSKGSSGDKTPTPTTKTPTATTEAPTETPAATVAPETPTPDTAESTSSKTNSDDNGTSQTTKATTAPSMTTTSSTESDPTQSSKTPTSSSDSGAEKALTSNSTATSGSPAVVNLALIGGAVVLVVIVLAFVARRVVKKKKMSATQERTISSHNSAWSDRTLGTGASGGNLYSTYSYKDNDGKDGISMLSDSQASSDYGPAYPGHAMHSGSSPRSTADFSDFGEHSKYAESSQYYSDYSVSAGPEANVVGGAQPPYANNSVPPSARANNFVDVTASSSMRGSELDSIRSGQQPLTVSQLMPTAIDEDEEEAYATRRRPGNQQFSAAYNLQTANAAVPPTTRQPQIFAASGASTASSMRSDYDIVDPITMRDVEARNTEMLAEDSRYPKFSFESEASSADIYDGSSSEEESDDEQVVHGEEHTI